MNKLYFVYLFILIVINLICGLALNIICPNIYPDSNIKNVRYSKIISNLYC